MKFFEILLLLWCFQPKKDKEKKEVQLDKRDTIVGNVMTTIFILISIWFFYKANSFGDALVVILLIGALVFFPLAGLYYNLISKSRHEHSLSFRALAVFSCSLWLLFGLSMIISGLTQDNEKTHNNINKTHVANKTQVYHNSNNSTNETYINNTVSHNIKK